LVLDASTAARSQANGTPLIYAVPAAGGAPQAIGPTPSESSSLAFSNDGTKLAYYDDDSSSLIVIDTLSGELSSVPIPVGCGPLSWAPDRQFITCGTDDVLVVDILGGSTTQLTHCDREPLEPPSQCGEPSWSHDGKLISYSRWRLYDEDPLQGLHLIAAECIRAPDTCPERTSGPIPIDGLVGWSPDASRLAAYVPPDIIVYDLAGEQLQVLPIRGSVYGRPEWSPRGDSIAFDDIDQISLLRVEDGTVEPFYPEGLATALGWVSIGDSPDP
jgi:Tol biopolymer transport system component